MSCDFHGFPHPTVSWSGVRLTSGGRFNVTETLVREEGMEFVRSELSISPVADYDDGDIVCTGDNGEDQLEHSFSLEVLSELSVKFPRRYVLGLAPRPFFYMPKIRNENRAGNKCALCPLSLYK